MAKLTAPTDRKTCAAMLRAIEVDLLREIPQTVRAQKIKKTAYGLLLCYIDLTTSEYTPFAVALPASYRETCVANRDVSQIWCLAEAPRIDCPAPSGKALVARCQLVYDYLSELPGDKGDEELLRPFREMIFRVCRKLNNLDWSKILPVTDDFVVMASDWSAGFWLDEDGPASVPVAKQRILKKKGFFFNPEDLPETPVAAKNPINGMGKKHVDEQVIYWVSQLDGLSKDTPCDAKLAKWGVDRVVKSLVNLGAPGADALLSFVEQYAGEPEWEGGRYISHSSERGPKSVALASALSGVEECASPTPTTERRLWEIFEKSVKANKKLKFWGQLPASAAFCISRVFSPKYDFWVVRDFTNKIESLKEIRKQRRERSGLDAKKIK